jgi:hypothetical protein
LHILKIIKGIKIMSKQAGPGAAVWQIWMPGADRSYTAAHDWIHQTIAAGKTLCLPDEKTLCLPDEETPADGEGPAGALVPMVPSEHRA